MELGPKIHTMHGCLALIPYWYYTRTLWGCAPQPTKALVFLLALAPHLKEVAIVCSRAVTTARASRVRTT